jgi:hypothetical protein
MVQRGYWNAAAFLADAQVFHARAAEFLMQALRLPHDDFDRHIAMEYERLARSAEDAARLLERLEDTPPD